MRETLRAIFSSYAEIFFLPSGGLGAVIFAATLIHPNVALAGIISVLAAYGFARLVRMEKPFLESGYYTYNPLLVGLSLGYLFELGALTVFFIVSAGVFTFLVTLFTASVFTTFFKLPILSVPFVVVSSIAYLGSLRYSNLLVSMHHNSELFSMTLNMPYWLAGFFRSFGAVLFAPSVIVGLFLSLIVLRYSRILMFLALFGYYTGAIIRGLMLGNFRSSFADLNNFNFIFIAMALGGVFLVPSLTSYLLAAIAVAISTLFLDATTVFWAGNGIPVFTLPFNVICLGMIYVLGLLRHPMIATIIGRTPEETLEHYLANRLRYSGHAYVLHLPFSGKWTVWQGFDGQWTHKGSWRYAYDFVITDDDGGTCSGDGKNLSDYYCYQKPVLSPIRGRIVQVIDDLPDCLIGGGDKTNNWGNLVIIQDPGGHYVELSHFAEKSIRVKKGDWVERGTLLGLCGNSGYSPQPHIHIQVQAAEAIGAASVPFSFASYMEAGEYQANNLPREKSVVEPLYRDKRLDSVTNLALDDQLHYEVCRGNKRIGELRLTVKMAADGTFYFQSKRGQLYFGKHEGTFYFYRITGEDPWLRYLFLALPRLPLAYRENMIWHDFVPVVLVTSGMREAMVGLLSSVYPALATVKVTQRFVTENRVESFVESGLLHVQRKTVAEMDRNKGFSKIIIEDMEIRRVDDDES